MGSQDTTARGAKWQWHMDASGSSRVLQDRRLSRGSGRTETVMMRMLANTY